LEHIFNAENRRRKESPTGSRGGKWRSPLSTAASILGDKPSSLDSVIGDGGCGGDTYSTLNFASCTSLPASLLNCNHTQHVPQYSVADKGNHK